MPPVPLMPPVPPVALPDDALVEVALETELAVSPPTPPLSVELSPEHAAKPVTATTTTIERTIEERCVRMVTSKTILLQKKKGPRCDPKPLSRAKESAARFPYGAPAITPRTRS
jgi:hypothetical protein